MEEIAIHFLAIMKGFGEIETFTAHKNSQFFDDGIEIEGVTEDGIKFHLEFSMKKEAKDA